MEYFVLMTPNFTCDYFESILTEKGRIIVWKPADNQMGKGDRSEKRKTERLELLRMLNSLGYSTTELYYKSTGQPMLAVDSSEYLSLSHSNGWYAIYISNEPVGVDIEVERDSIQDGKSWFVNPREWDFFLTHEELHCVWGAKEAYYKKLEGQIADLRQEVTIQQILESSLILEHEDREERLFHKKIENAYLVWTI